MKKNVSFATTRRAGAPELALTLILFTLAFVSVRQQSPPRATPASAPPVEFSSGRAMKHLRAIAQTPHPIGSEAHAQVRDYILAELSATGVQPEVQQTTAINNSRASTTAATVQNIVARLRGTGGAKAVMLASHYDSVPTGPGASDDGAAVAMMLETLRALKSGPALANDVIFLFTDGEESGLLGARAFVDENPSAKDVGVVLNFEARGVRGQSIMFETSNGNGWLVAGLDKAAPNPAATSVAYEVYRFLPNDTDMTVFKKAGMPGLGFAYIEGLTSYHTRLDSLNNIDERSLQHHGSNALALTRHFGQLNLQGKKEPNTVYFNTFGTYFVEYPGAWIIPLTLLVVLLFAGVLVVGFRRKRLTVKGLTIGALAFLSNIILAPLAVTLAWWLIRKLHKGYEQILQGDTYNSYYYMLGFVSLAIAVAAAIYLWFGRRVSVENLAVGGLLWWLALMVAVNLFLPGGSYLFTWPLLFILAGLLIVFASKNAEALSVKSSFILVLFALPGVLLFGPLLYQTYVALSLRQSGAVILLLAVLLGLLIPYMVLMGLRLRWIWPGALAILCAGFIVAGSLTSNFDNAHPEPYNLFYALNADTNKAVWGSSDETPDEWTAQFIPTGAGKDLLLDFFPANSQKFWTSSAPVVAALIAPEVQVLEDRTEQEARILRLRVVSTRRAPYISVNLDSNAKPTLLALNGRNIDSNNANTSQGAQNRWALRYYAPPVEGIELLFKLDAAQPVKLRVVDRSYGYPELPGAPFKPRPDYLMPAPLPYSDISLVSKSFTF